jgi:septal ring factor EnvC (AmiA/AmiB activator)
MSNPNPILDRLKALGQQINGMGTNVVLNNSKAFVTLLNNKLNAIVASIKALSQASQMSKNQLQELTKNLQQTQQQLKACQDANAGQNQALDAVLKQLETSIGQQVANVNEINKTTDTTTNNFNSLVANIEQAIQELSNMIGQPGQAPPGPIAGGYKRRKRLFSKKGKRRNKKGGWVINSESNKSSRFSKTKKRKYRNSENSSSSASSS